MSNIVLFTQRVEIVESYNERRDCADQRIAEFIQSCGYLPVPVPNQSKVAERMVEELNPAGIILTGGNSLVKYGGNAPERDETDIKLIEAAIDNYIPLYGICRGMQSILDYFGNELMDVSGHVAIRHGIEGNEDPIEVNSYHNQGCMELKSAELEIVMKATDGVIEKIRHRTLPIMATMWHPERENLFRNIDMNMVRKLIGKD